MQHAVVLSALKGLYPNPRHYLNFNNPFELVVATILSMQCADDVVNTTTEKLFKRYKKPEDFENMPLVQIETDIRCVAFFREKALAIKDASTIIAERYSGRVPDSMEEILKIPGIERKSAKSILAYGFDKVEGIIVDTHVIRLSQRLGWTKQKISGRVEKELMQLFERSEWKWLPYYLKSHGQAVCAAKGPDCSACPVNTLCPSAF